MTEFEKPKRNGNRFETAIQWQGKHYPVHIYAEAVGFAPGVVPRKALSALEDWKDENAELLDKLRRELNAP
jgi:hypothetical protein